MKLYRGKTLVGLAVMFVVLAHGSWSGTIGGHCAQFALWLQRGDH